MSITKLSINCSSYGVQAMYTLNENPPKVVQFVKMIVFTNKNYNIWQRSENSFILILENCD